MANCKCNKCGKEYYEVDYNPNIHYSTPSNKCRQCEVKERLKEGDWYQEYNGNWNQKGKE